MTDTVGIQDIPLDEVALKEIAEIVQCLADIRAKNGYGRIVIDLRGGEIQEIEYSVKRRPKLEKKEASKTQ